ncbi:extracellular solute-binding protein [Shouchella clausii]|uniref:extracellular solute-binding protein n=1 Tax=Shouchella clausii TaxID=79880 RepID=UPI00280AEBFD|nr:extracellular solute-binding protein [Shouchella clausii]WMM33255.1 extracellular solute-binding protein [Shouchella clausii]
MRQKAAIVVCISMMGLFVLSACGNSNEDAGTESEGENHQGDIVLELWQNDASEKEKVYQDAIARFEDKNPGVTVNMQYIPNDDYKQRMVVAVSGGDPPDVFFSWGGSWLKEFADAGQVVSLNDYDIDFDKFLDVALTNTTFEDEVYGLPLGLTQTLFFYNKEIFNEYGLEEPQTYDEFLEIVDTLKENDIIPITLTNQTKWPGTYYLMYFADRLGGEDLFQGAFNRDGTGFDDESYVKAGEYIQDLVDRGAFNPGFNGVPYDAGQGRQLLYSGQSAMMLMTNTFISSVRTEAPEFEEKLGMFEFPEIAEGNGDPSNVGGATSPVWSVSSATEHPDLAVELINELTSIETAEDYVNRTGSIAAIKDIETDDPFIKRIDEIAANANDIHMPYDQTLPPALAELHLDTTQQLFGKTLTPEEAASQMEEKAKELLD